MERGLQAESKIIEEYYKTQPDWQLSYPYVFEHPSIAYLMGSPDGVAVNSGQRVLVEVKDSINTKTEKQLRTLYNDQVQHNMLVGDCTAAKLLVSQKDHVLAIDIEPDKIWQQRYLLNAQKFYETYLAWLHETPINARVGKSVVSALLAQRPKSKSTTRKKHVRTLRKQQSPAFRMHHLLSLMKWT